MFKKSATKILRIKGDLAISFCSSSPTVSRYWNISKNHKPNVHYFHEHTQFPFSDI